MRHWSLRLRVGFALSLLAVAATGAGAQTGSEGMEAVFPTPQFLVGYVANAPEQLMGVGAAWLPPFLNGWGLYVDVKQDASDPSNDDTFLPGVAAEDRQAGTTHELRVTRSSYRSVNVALVRAFRSDLILYAGGGVADETVYGEFFDPTQEEGRLGHYWAEFMEIGGPRPNAMAGIYFRLARYVTAQFGAEILPVGFTVGLHVTL